MWWFRYTRSFRPGAWRGPLAGARQDSLCCLTAFVTASPSLAHLLGEAADVVADDVEFEDHQQVVDRGNENADRREYRYLGPSMS